MLAGCWTSIARAPSKSPVWTTRSKLHDWLSVQGRHQRCSQAPVARGGSWVSDKRLLRRIEAAALGQASCTQVRVVR
jgi:hypothetical protein